MQLLSNHRTMKRLGIFLGLLLVAVLLMQFAWRVSLPNETLPTSEKVNLALRRTAHLLLKESGDSTSAIPPVLETNNNVWLLTLERSFNYDSLPKFLQSSLALHNISCKYNTSVLDCNTGAIRLGYNAADVSDPNASVPCQGREEQSACYNIRLTLLPETTKSAALPWLLAALLSFVPLILLLRWKPMPIATTATATNPIIAEEQQMPIEASTASNPIPEVFSFAGFRLDTNNLLLVSGNQQHKLTYREAKLLRLFVEQPNQILERTFIVDKVWGEEGIMVGRSLDMFVSRLRKLLREDTSVQIVAVHGVGYRLEITPVSPPPTN